VVFRGCRFGPLGERCGGLHWSGFGGGGVAFHRLVGVSVWLVREPEVAIMPEHDAQCKQKQTERPNHEFALGGILGRAASRIRQESAIRLGCEGIQI
jgi:hypothetical protein